MKEIDLKEMAVAIHSRIADYDRDSNQLFFDDSIPYGSHHMIFIHMKIDANFVSVSQSRPDIKELNVWNLKNDIEAEVKLSDFELYDVEEFLFELLDKDIER